MNVVRFIVSCTLFLLLTNVVYAINIYAVPGEINFSKALIGGYAERTIVITTDSETSIQPIVSATGKIKDWISFDPGIDLKVSKDIPLDLKVIMKPPLIS